MAGGQWRKGWGDGMRNGRLGGGEAWESVSHLVDIAGMAIDTYDCQLG